MLALLVAAAVAGWDIALAPDSEPGRKLVVSGVVRKAPGGPPLAGVSVYAYHADGNGLYALKGQEKKGPRLAGTLRTREDGRYLIRTVYPGTYGGPPHVHFEMWGKGIARRAFVLNLAAASLAMPATPETSRVDRAQRKGQLSSGLDWVDRPQRQGKLSPGLAVPVRDTKGVLHVTYDIDLTSGSLMPR